MMLNPRREKEPSENEFYVPKAIMVKDSEVPSLFRTKKEEKELGL